MPFGEGLRIALYAILGHKLRSFFTLLGIIVSVGFLVAVVAIIQGMNAYVEENLANAVIGSNSFQIRRTPIAIGLIDDEEWRVYQRRPNITLEDVEHVRRALPDARAIALQSGWPFPFSDVEWRNRRVGDALVVGITPPYQVVQDYQFAAGEALNEIDNRQRRHVAILGWDVADNLFGLGIRAPGHYVRVAGRRFLVKGVIERKGNVLGQSFDGFVLIPFTTHDAIWGRRRTTIISVKMPSAASVDDGMLRAEEAMRIAHGLRPGERNDFTVQAAEALVAFWKNLTRLLFTVIPAVVALGIVVGGIVIMNIMLMSVNERTHEIGIRKALGATRRDIRHQFLAESVILATLGGLMGLAAGWSLASLIATTTPLPARVTMWSIAVALGLGTSVGVVFGVYPAARAARLDPVTALHIE